MSFANKRLGLTATQAKDAMPGFEANSIERRRWREIAFHALRAFASIVAIGLLIVLAVILAAVVISDQG